MTIRSIGLGVLYELLLALGSGVSLASSASTIVGDNVHHYSTFCLINIEHFSSRYYPQLSPRRLALHCYCCGRDENGHCNRRCCDP